MSYRYYAQKRNPVSLWLLDDTAPFQEYNASGFTADTKAGSTTPTQAAPLVAGANRSAVFDNLHQGTFDCPVFQQGREDHPFALEAWVAPVRVADDQNQSAQTFRRNYVTNPSFETNRDNWGIWAGTGGTVAESRPTTGGYDGKSHIRGTWSVASTGNGDISHFVALDTFAPGDVISFSGWIRASTSRSFIPGIAWQNDDGTTNSTITGTSVAGTANTWIKIGMNNVTIPTGIRRFKIMFRTVTGLGVNETVDVDFALLEEAAAAGTYFDGTRYGYEWTGTAHASASRTKLNVSKVNRALNPAAITGGSVAEFIGRFSWSGSHVSSNDGPIAGLNTYYRRTCPSTQTAVTGRGIDMYANYETSPGITGNAILQPVSPGETITISHWVRWSVALPQAIHTCRFLKGDGTWTSTVVSPTFNAPANTWVRLSLTTTVPEGGVYLAARSTYSGTATFATGATQDMTGVLIQESPTLNDYFDFRTSGAISSGTENSSPSLMLLSGVDQKILSHASAFDGLTINGTVVKFSTNYLTAPAAECSYDLQTIRAAHVAGVYTPDQNMLFVDGELVETIYLTDEQKADTFVATDGKLYSGETQSGSGVAVNGVAFYGSISGETFVQNFDAGRRVIPQSRVATQLDGRVFNLNAALGSIFIEKSWTDASDFRQGWIQSVSIDDEAIYPEFVDSISQPGSWTCGISLDGNGATSIYGVMAEWSAVGVTVESSTDGSSWTEIKSGELIPTLANGVNPAGLDLEIRFTFAGGVEDDAAFIESVTVIGFENNNFENSQSRVITASHPAVLRKDYEPIQYRDDNGVTLNGATLTIGIDTSDEPQGMRTFEMWVKPKVASAATNLTALNTYVNGVSGTNIPIGQWSLVHITTAADIPGSITVTGDCIIGQAALYPTALTATEVLHIFQSYTGIPVVRLLDTSTVTISEPASPIEIYSHAWAIDGAGG